MGMKTVVVGMSLLACPVMAFAENGGGGGVGFTDLPGIKARCAQLQSNEQIKPFSVRVTCREVRYLWRLAEQLTPPTARLRSQREVGGSIFLKNMEVPYSGSNMPSQDTVVSCPVYQKFKQTISAVDVELSCDELKAINSLAQYCAPIIEARIAQDPSAIVTEPLNEKVNICSGLAQDIKGQ